MAILAKGTSKKFYTRANDEKIIEMLSEKKTIQEISKEIDHSPASVSYRIQRVLKSDDYASLDDIKYKGTTTEEVEEA